MATAMAEGKPFAALRLAWEYKVPTPYRQADRVFQLDGVGDDPRFRGMTLAGGDPWAVSMLLEPASTLAELKAIQANWRAPRVSEWCAAWTDCTFARPRSLPIVSERAFNALHDLITPCCAVLPLGSRGRRYYLLVARVLRGVLDTRHSVVRRSLTQFGRRVSNVDRYKFHSKRLSDAPIFRSSHNPFRTFVTDPFVQRVKSCDLTGFTFAVVYPLRADDNWNDLSWRAERRHMSEGLPKGQTISGKRVHVTFILDDADRAPTTRQEKTVKAWATRVDRELFDVDSMDPPIGHFDMTSMDTGRLTCVFRGPDADKMIAKIRPLVAGAGWTGETTIGLGRERG